MFSGRNARAPPSSFNASTLHLNPTNGRNENSRRHSGIDFEDALNRDVTLRINDSVPVEQLGVYDSPAPSPAKPPPMNVVPPTPSPERKRVSVYRQTGFSSSPDLASLLKSKTKQQPPPPLPSSPNTQRSSSFMAPSSSTSSPKGKSGTVRSKTSGFLGKLWQGTVRERSKTDASLAQESSSNASPVPPVPPIPSDIPKTSPSQSPIADAFSVARFPDSQSKPLPPIMLSPVPRDEDDNSIVLVNKPSRTPSPAASNRSKRRSMSVSDTDFKQIFASASPPFTLPSAEDTPEKASRPPRRRLLSDLQGELSSLDPERSPTLDLRDPSTPGRLPARRSQTDSPPIHKAERPELQSHSSSPSQPGTPKFAFASPSDSETSPHASPIVPARSSSLNSSPTRFSRPASSGSVGLSSANTTANSTIRPKAARSSVQGPRDSNRLRVLHRSAASSSEPSLISNGDEVTGSSSNHTGSQRDFSNNTVTLTTFPSSSSQSLARSDGSNDMDSKGKHSASKCFHEDEDFLPKEKIAEWLGGHGALNKVALHYYMEFFDFSNLRLDMAFRRLCAKLYLKAETQQVDRILEEFSKRYWTCNPTSVYGSSNLVHAVSYSLLLLNTDLHVADLVTRMSRSQFVRNTLTAIQMQIQTVPRERHASFSDAGHDDSPVTTRSTSDGVLDSAGTITGRTHRSDSITSWNSVTKDVITASPGSTSATNSPIPGHHSNGSTVSMQRSNSGHERPHHAPPVYGRAWENDMESLLKEMYNAIKSQQILQPLNSGPARLSTSSLTPGTVPLMRNRSLRGGPPDRLTTLKRGSIRGLQTILGAQNGSSPYSSNSSIDGRISPSPSFAGSTHEALYGSSSSFLTPTLGFASNLSHTIIRETQEDDDHRSTHSDGSDSTTISISDEELALLGAPWAKEGMLCRKQYWEASGKRAKDKSWLDVFVVIQKGELNMFTFGEHGSAGRGIFGGGNWLANADPVGTVQLAHSLAHALPPPGYNRQRPHCMVLTLSNGGVYFFQAGTEELVNEWVSTCNYWAARTSKEPLAGGVSNMEYGWSRVMDPMHSRSQSDSESLHEDPADTLSVKSGRSSRSRFGWREGAATVRATSSPWADRIFINDWKPPMHPTVSSMHDEETQMEALQKHVASMKRDIKRHNELREPMLGLYQPRSANAVKAQSNWEKKSRYLLAEIVKYDSYVESLKAAMSLRLKKRGEKALEQALRGNSPGDEKSSAWKGTDDGTIHEDDEPDTPAANRSHHRVPDSLRSDD